jgi:ankyrin repeat protein
MYILLRSENIDQVDSYRRILLHTAASYKSLRAAKALIEFNALINVKDKNGNTPLHLAVAQNCKEVVNLLLSCGVDVQICDNKGETALHLANTNADVVRGLANAGANVTILDVDEWSPLHAAVRFASFELKYKDTIEVLIRKGADITLVDGNGKTARQLARERGMFEYISRGRLSFYAHRSLEHNQSELLLF